MDVKLYVGNLAFTTTEDDLRILFAQAGAIHSIDLIKDRDTGESKGFAFVTMANPTDAAKAIGMFNEFTMQNRELKVNPAKAREEQEVLLRRIAELETRLAQRDREAQNRAENGSTSSS